MTQVCDFASPQNLNAIKAAGLAGIIRYVSDYPWKNITQAEFNQAHELGLTVTLVCEQGNQPALRGVLGGMHDSTIANQQADALGYAKDATIYYVAEDPNVLPQSDWPTVVAYFQGLAWGGNRPKGAYGSGPLCEHLLSLGLVAKTWTVSTWGTPVGNSLEQMVNANTFGLSIDVDQVLQSDYGQDPRPAPPQPSPSPTPYPEDNVISTPITFAISGGNGWAPSPVPVAKVISVEVLTENPDVVGRYDNTPLWRAGATQAGVHSPNGSLVFTGGANGNYSAVVWSVS